MSRTHQHGRSETALHWGIWNKRRARGWSPRQLASEAGLSHVTVAAVENCRVQPHESTKFAIAQALEVSVFELWP